MSNKRDDLQGVRGLAILAVILFHFFPNYFPNGYVGVDQFFILSGFLMAKILSKDSSISCKGVLFFYYRRFKRILPLYSFFVLLTMICAILFFEKNMFDFNIVHAVRSLLFISNTETANKNKDYERMLANADVLFTHTWSLSSEVQFYAIAPFMILNSIYLSKTMFTVLTSITCLISFVLFGLLFQNESTRSFAFNSMLTRIWQFSLGILGFHLTPPESESNGNYKWIPNTDENFNEMQDLSVDMDQTDTENNLISSDIIPSLLVVLCSFSSLFSYIIPPLILRLTVCITSTVLIYMGAQKVNRLLSLNMLVYLGDISYSLYLFHWPIYVYVKRNYEHNMIALCLGIGASIILAILSTEVYEKFYLRQNMKFITVLCVTLYLVNFGLIAAMKPKIILINNSDIGMEPWRLPANLTDEQIIKINEKLNAEDDKLVQKTEDQCQLIEYLQWWKYCKFNNTEYTGNNRIMLLGNSYARNLGRLILAEKSCRQKAKEIYMLSTSACEVLEDTTPYWSTCKGANADHIEAVNRTRPDYVFLLSRHFMSMNPLNGTDDPVLAEELIRIAILEKLVSKKIFILDALPKTKVWKLVDNVNNAIKANKSIPSNESFLDGSGDYKIARHRMRVVVENCAKCELIDVMPIFMKNNIYQHYDEKDRLIHFAYSMHFTNYALAKIRPIFDDICKRL